MNIARDIISSGTRLVLDTDVVVAGLRSPTGASRQLLLAALRQEFSLLASTALWLEYEAVLLRPEQLKAIGLVETEVLNILKSLALVASPVNIRFRWRPALSDPDDEFVLDAAINGRADMLVTFNASDLAVAAQRFQICVVTPGEALQQLRLIDESK